MAHFKKTLKDVGEFHTASLWWQSVGHFIELAHNRVRDVPLGHLLEGPFESFWKVLKQFYRTRSNYRDDATDIMHYRAYQGTMKYIKGEYGFKTQKRHSHMPPNTAVHIVLCPCVLGCTMFLTNQYGFYTHLRSIQGAGTVYRAKADGEPIVLMKVEQAVHWILGCMPALVESTSNRSKQ